ncbi:hypothetical protein J4474_03205 [Candidatus Pacearchaeota archaeon]|nr:hypothetical protein [Candidatus Pacearchaeota archaeon]
MATPSYRQRVGLIEIRNKEKKEREEKKKREETKEENVISEEEHKKRLDKLKELGLVK